NDGDLDLLSTNLGENTLLQASQESPELMFLLPPQENEEGPHRIVLAGFEGGICFPKADRNAMLSTFPQLAQDAPTHRAYASQTLRELFGVEVLRNAPLKKVTELRSGAFYNDGTGYFSFEPFPADAQTAPCFGIAISDLNLDGSLDCVLTQNTTRTHPILGPLNGGAGTVLRNNPSATRDHRRLQSVSPSETGIHFGDDITSAVFVDLNRDARPDLVAGRNNASLQAYIAQAQPGDTLPFTVRLKGEKGNPTAVGALVRVHMPTLPIQTRERKAGSGYLSSDHAPLTFARPADNLLVDVRVEVRLPDGSWQEEFFPMDRESVVMEPNRPEPVPSSQPESADLPLGPRDGASAEISR
ncbi:MAG: CRTAC1 family protein, partial [Verrucomicrobiota bacterium]